MILSDLGHLDLCADGALKVKLNPHGMVGQLAQAKNILQAIGQRVNNQEN
jgi:hypothetical protein